MSLLMMMAVVVSAVVIGLRVTVPVPGRNGRGRVNGAVLCLHPFVADRFPPAVTHAVVRQLVVVLLMVIVVRRVRRGPSLVLPAGHRRRRQPVVVRRRRTVATAAVVVVSVRGRPSLVVVRARRRRRRCRRWNVSVVEVIPPGRGSGRFHSRSALRAFVPVVRRRWRPEIVLQVVVGRVAPWRRSRFVVILLRK